MKFQNPLLAVTDLERSVVFYQQVLGLRKIADFGANVTLTGGLCLQTLDTWKEFLHTDQVTFGSHAGELYFEEEDFTGFVQRLGTMEIRYVHPVQEHAWGQRVVRFYDPDGHIIEVGEPLRAVCKRFSHQGMTPEEIAARMDVPAALVHRCLRG